MNMRALVLAHTCAHACIVAHMHGPVHHRNGIFSHTLHIPDGYTCMWHTINLSGIDGTHTHKHCDMHMYSIPFIKLLLCMFV